MTLSIISLCNQNEFTWRSTANWIFSSFQDSCQYRNTSSEDEGEGENTFDTLATATSLGPAADPAATSLVQSATQQMGLQGADGAAFALAALRQSNPEDAIRLLAAASAKANLDNHQLQRQQVLTSNSAARALTTAGLASEGIGNSDATCDNRNKRQNTINDQMDLSLQHLYSVTEGLNSADQLLLQQLQAAQGRIARLEGMLGRVLTMLLNSNVDANQVNICSHLDCGEENMD